jgi:hypothetical protein
MCPWSSLIYNRNTVCNRDIKQSTGIGFLRLVFFFAPSDPDNFILTDAYFTNLSRESDPLRRKNYLFPINFV